MIISGCRFAGDGSYLATCSWSGAFKLWSLPECRKALTVRAHDERCTGIATHPESGAGRTGDPAAWRTTGGATQLCRQCHWLT